MNIFYCFPMSPLSIYILEYPLAGKSIPFLTNWELDSDPCQLGNSKRKVYNFCLSKPM